VTDDSTAIKSQVVPAPPPADCDDRNITTYYPADTTSSSVRDDSDETEILDAYVAKWRNYIASFLDAPSATSKNCHKQTLETIDPYVTISYDEEKQLCKADYRHRDMPLVIALRQQLETELQLTEQGRQAMHETQVMQQRMKVLNDNVDNNHKK